MPLSDYLYPPETRNIIDIHRRSIYDSADNKDTFDKPSLENKNNNLEDLGFYPDEIILSLIAD